MHKRIAGTALWIAVSAVSAIAQMNGSYLLTSPSTPVTSQGIYASWNNLTGGTGESDFINSSGNGSGGFAFLNVPSSGTPISTLMFIDGNGNLGIGITSPGAKLDILEQPNERLLFGGDANGWYPGSASIVAVNGTNTAHVPFGMYASQYAFLGGKVGIGTTTPGAPLDIAGNIKLSGTGAHILFPDGSAQSTAWSGTLCGGDYAESVDVTGKREEYEPGDVLIVDSQNPAHFLKSSEPYSTAVSGVYSTKPGLIGRRQATDPKNSASEIPMAMVGIVPTKVSAENGSIHPGDVLVTSSTLGHAMKGTDRSQFAGAIVGKALGSLDSGTGVIEVLVSLQ